MTDKIFESSLSVKDGKSLSMFKGVLIVLVLIGIFVGLVLYTHVTNQPSYRVERADQELRVNCAKIKARLVLSKTVCITECEDTSLWINCEASCGSETKRNSQAFDDFCSSPRYRPTGS